MANKTNPSPTLGSDSTLCLSCHDGTVAGSPGNLVAYGTVKMSGSMLPQDVFGTDLSAVHPFSFILPLQPSPDLVSSLTATPPSTADTTGAVKLIKGNVECTSCHNPHVQNTDPNNPVFLAIDNSSSALCLACHTTNDIPTGSGMGMDPTALRASRPTSAARSISPAEAKTRPNPLAEWNTSIHATAQNRVARRLSTFQPRMLSQGANAASASTSIDVGKYGSVGRNGCASCHTTHKAKGVKSLLRASDDQTCISCHNGSTNLSPVAPNILSEIVAPKNGHEFTPANSPHQQNESALLNQNRHAACVDCHNPHSSKQVAGFQAAPAIRASQSRVLGVSASDGQTVLSPAINQYENCLRCHGSSTGKQTLASLGYLPRRVAAATDPLNVLLEFNSAATSSHPVMHDRNSTLPQPSLRSNMLSLDGMTQARSLGSRIFCTDCHNSDDNREFGGKGPNGPHGSIFPHVLERRYESSQSSLPGSSVTNLFPNPSLSAQGGAAGGPYALCAKCHDMQQIMANSSFTQHATHIRTGFSCSVCHTAHGMGARMTNVSGERMVNFDMNVVAANTGSPVSYNRATKSCTLTCHNAVHNADGSVIQGSAGLPNKVTLTK